MTSKNILGAMLIFAAPFASAGTAMSIELAGTYQCATPQGSMAARWTIELDDRVPLAVVNDEDRPAEYTPLHIRILLAPEGPMLTIGRISGRVLESSPSGETLALGQCERAIHT